MYVKVPCTVHIFTKFSDLVASKWGVTIAYILKLKPFRLYNGVGFKSWLCISKGVQNYHRRPVACTRVCQRGSAK